MTVTQVLCSSCLPLNAVIGSVLETHDALPVRPESPAGAFSWISLRNLMISLAVSLVLSVLFSLVAQSM